MAGVPPEARHAKSGQQILRQQKNRVVQNGDDKGSSQRADMHGSAKLAGLGLYDG